MRCACAKWVGASSTPSSASPQRRPATRSAECRRSWKCLRQPLSGRGPGFGPRPWSSTAATAHDRFPLLCRVATAGEAADQKSCGRLRLRNETVRGYGRPTDERGRGPRSRGAGHPGLAKVPVRAPAREATGPHLHAWRAQAPPPQGIRPRQESANGRSRPPVMWRPKGPCPVRMPAGRPERQAGAPRRRKRLVDEFLGAEGRRIHPCHGVNQCVHACLLPSSRSVAARAPRFWGTMCQRLGENLPALRMCITLRPGAAGSQGPVGPSFHPVPALLKHSQEHLRRSPPRKQCAARRSCSAFPASAGSAALSVFVERSKVKARFSIRQLCKAAG